MEDKVPFIISGGIFVMAFLIATANAVSQIQQNGLTSDAFFAGCIAVTVSVVGLIGSVIAMIWQNHSLKKKIGGEKKGKSIHTQLGVSKDDKSISLQLGAGKSGKSITEQLGIEASGKSITDQLGIKASGKSITEQTGVGIYDKSLSAQHNEIIDLINQRRRDEKERMKKFTDRQKDTKKKVEEINEFLQDWEQKIIEAQNLRAELQVLQVNYNKVIDRISSLTVENEALKHDIKLLSSAHQANEMDESEDMHLEL